MSAALSFNEEFCWGTNGAVESCLRALLTVTQRERGALDPMVSALEKEVTAFYPGAVVTLEDCVPGEQKAVQLLPLLAAASNLMADDPAWTDEGRQWLRSELREFQERVAAAA